MTALAPAPSPFPNVGARFESGSGYRRLLLAHLALGLAVFALPVVATVFAAVVLVQVIRVCLTARRADDVVVAIAYLAGIEVLWRMAEARVPWEFSKYLVVLLAASGLIRFAKHPRVGLPLAYIALLVPGAVLTLNALSLGPAREAIVSNVLGPVTLAAVAALCSSMRTTAAAAARIMWSALLATVPMATFMLLTLLTTKNLTFTDESNFAASGNFGPNQVAASLSFALVAALLLVTVLGERRYRTVLLALGAWFLVASFLTFSRGGLVSFAVAALLVAVLQVGDTRRLLITMVMVAMGSVLVFGVVFPRLDTYTGGQLSRRYQDKSSAHRTSIVAADGEVFLEHPFLGVGAGESPEYRRAGEAQGRQAHVEYSRLLAEHGLFGLGAMVALVWMCLVSLRRAADRRGRAWCVGLFAWSLVTMAHSDMRVAAVSVAFGLGCLALTDRRWPEHRSAVGARAGSRVPASIPTAGWQ